MGGRHRRSERPKGNAARKGWCGQAAQLPTRPFASARCRPQLSCSGLFATKAGLVSGTRWREFVVDRSGQFSSASCDAARRSKKLRTVSQSSSSSNATSRPGVAPSICRNDQHAKRLPRSCSSQKFTRQCSRPCAKTSGFTEDKHALRNSAEGDRLKASRWKISVVRRCTKSCARMLREFILQSYAHLMTWSAWEEPYKLLCFND